MSLPGGLIASEYPVRAGKPDRSEQVSLVALVAVNGGAVDLCLEWIGDPCVVWAHADAVGCAAPVVGRFRSFRVNVARCASLRGFEIAIPLSPSWFAVRSLAAGLSGGRFVDDGGFGCDGRTAASAIIAYHRRVMSNASVYLLGTPTVARDGTRHVLPLTRPVWLLAYLAIRQDWVARDELAYLFRPDASEATARHYIRNLILRSRALPTGVHVETRRDHCRLRVDTDVSRFLGAVAGARWEEAIAHYGGALLEGLNACDTPAFANWLEQQRAELTSAWSRSSMAFAEDLEASHRNADAANILERLLHSDPLNEQALQAFIRNAALSGQRMRALEAGDRFVTELRGELGIDPDEATLALLGRVRRSEAIDDVPQIADLGSQRRWSSRSGCRPDEIAEIASLLKHPEHRLLTLIGPERSGEPMLLVARRPRHVDSAAWAVIDLAETLMARRHYRRATELLALIASRRSLDPDLGRRFDAVIRELGRHVPRRIIDALLEV